MPCVNDESCWASRCSTQPTSFYCSVSMHTCPQGSRQLPKSQGSSDKISDKILTVAGEASSLWTAPSQLCLVPAYTSALISSISAFDRTAGRKIQPRRSRKNLRYWGTGTGTEITILRAAVASVDVAILPIGPYKLYGFCGLRVAYRFWVALSGWVSLSFNPIHSST